MINEQIRGREIRLIGEDGQQLGIMSSREAMKIAREAELDLVKIARVLKGYGEARKILKKLKPDVVFSKGGFVAVPVVLAAKHLHIPVIIHESDMTPGLANKISLSAATKVCCNFPETMGYIPEGKAVLTGSPIREELLHGNKLAALNLCGFAANKPVILVIGGSQGSVAVNDAVRGILPELLKKYQVIHLCGKGKLDSTKTDMEGYIQF